MSAERLAIFQRMQENWANLPTPRCALFVRETSRFSIETLQDAVSTVMARCHYAPVLEDVLTACAEADRRAATRRPSRKRVFRPGEPGPDGRPTFTSEEARIELRRLRASNPEWFGSAKVVPVQGLTEEQRRQQLELLVSRLYVAGLRKCADLDGRSISVATQANLF